MWERIFFFRRDRYGKTIVMMNGGWGGTRDTNFEWLLKIEMNIRFEIKAYLTFNGGWTPSAPFPPPNTYSIDICIHGKFRKKQY